MKKKPNIVEKAPKEKSQYLGVPNQQETEMPSSDASGSSTPKASSEFRSLKQALKKPFVSLSQKGTASLSVENLSLPVVKSGWLSKQGGVVKSWNSRWFVLRGSTLFYYAGEDEIKQLGIISLEGNKIEIQDAAYGKYLFQIVPGKLLTFV